jgi:hypothetical protein
VPKTPSPSSSTLDTGLQVNYRETCCHRQR